MAEQPSYERGDACLGDQHPGSNPDAKFWFQDAIVIDRSWAQDGYLCWNATTKQVYIQPFVLSENMRSTITVPEIVEDNTEPVFKRRSRRRRLPKKDDVLDK